MAFDILDAARINISRTENAKLICQCHYLSADNQTEAQHRAVCPTDFDGLFYRNRRIKIDSFLFIFTLYSAKYKATNEPIFLDSTGCNKMIMIVTDGATESAYNVFQARNWSPNNVSTCHRIEVSTTTQRVVFVLKFNPSFFVLAL